MSEVVSSSSREEQMVMPSSAMRVSTYASRGFSRACTLMPNDTARSATESPIEPSPMMPMVFPSSPAALP